MPLNLYTLRLIISGALVGVAVAGVLGFDTSAIGPSGIASVLGAGATTIALAGCVGAAYVLNETFPRFGRVKVADPLPPSHAASIEPDQSSS